MSLKPERNALLTRVENDAPMGRLLRETAWFPTVLSSALIADDAPYSVRLLGEDLVAFRATDGRVGVFAEFCPHRGVSLLLARNEDNALRCIFHGWKFRVDGTTVEVPTQPHDHDAFCKKVPLRHYPTCEVAGVVWTWLGKGEPKPFPDLDFLKLTGDHIWAVRSVYDYNWLQHIEGLVDSAHISILHQDWLATPDGNPLLANAAFDTAPIYEFDERASGVRYAGIRRMPDGKRYVRISEFVSPWYCFTPGDGTCYIVVPVDDEHSALWAFRFDAEKPVPDSPWKPAADPMNWPPPLRGDRAARWGQDREKMKRGSFSGFTDHFFHEDVAVAASMGKIATRSHEFLNAGDVAVVRTRNLLLRALEDFQAGRLPASVPESAVRVGGAQFVIDPEADWRTYTPS